MGLSVSTMLDLRIAGLRDVHISCICPDGMWTPMLFDKLDDPGASMSFSGVLLQPSDVADVVAKVVRQAQAGDPGARLARRAWPGPSTSPPASLSSAAPWS